MERFIYAKQLFKGADKIIARSESGVGNWSTLKQTLLKELGRKLLSLEVHKMLRDRKKQIK